MRKPYPTPEEAVAKRAYVARGQHILSGAVPGRFERDTKPIRPEVSALVEAVLDKRGANHVEDFARTEK
jgi:hypothetical protein